MAEIAAFVEQPIRLFRRSQEERLELEGLLSRRRQFRSGTSLRPLRSPPPVASRGLRLSRSGDCCHGRSGDARTSASRSRCGCCRQYGCTETSPVFLRGGDRKACSGQLCNRARASGTQTRCVLRRLPGRVGVSRSPALPSPKLALRWDAKFERGRCRFRDRPESVRFASRYGTTSAARSPHRRETRRRTSANRDARESCGSPKSVRPANRCARGPPGHVEP